MFLKDICAELKSNNIRVSIFVDPDEKFATAAAECGTDRIELYTEAYASDYQINRDKAIKPFQRAALAAHNVGLGINAGHDLNLDNLRYFKQSIPNLLEVSIGHALICDAIYLGFENAINMYKRELR
jgi:pyridoxine 5-phosphate synthase